MTLPSLLLVVLESVHAHVTHDTGKIPLGGNKELSMKGEEGKQKTTKDKENKGTEELFNPQSLLETNMLKNPKQNKKQHKKPHAVTSDL